MRLTIWPTRTKARRATTLAGLILVQAVCALFFIGDVVEDFSEGGTVGTSHLFLETVAEVALVCGVIFLMIELRGLLSRMGHMETGLEIARGHLAEVIDTFFDDWRLTGAERNVAILILKGPDNDTIARLRKTASGTVRAQSASIYSKAATGGRVPFISLFMEGLMAGDIDPHSATGKALAAAPAGTAGPTLRQMT